MSEPVVRVVIADDHPLVREGLRGVLTSRGGFEIVADVGSGDEAVSVVERLLPDVIVMDLNMPGLHGIEATRRIAARSPGTAVLVLTMFEDDDSVFTAIRAGARGYIVKGAGQAEVAGAIEAVARGEAIFGPGIADRVLTLFAAQPPRPAEPFPELTEREREVLELLACGELNVTIAARIGTTQKTVRNHVSNIFTKLQVLDRAQAVIRARDAGYGIRPPDH